MARKECFKISNLQITFRDSNEKREKEKLISEGLNENLKNDDISYEILSRLTRDVDLDPMVIVIVKFENQISLIRLIEIINHIIKERINMMIYMDSFNELTVNVLKESEDD